METVGLSVSIEVRSRVPSPTSPLVPFAGEKLMVSSCNPKGHQDPLGEDAAKQYASNKYE